MQINPDSILKSNFKINTSNRFVVDSPRFWRKEFHPRFTDIFTVEEILEVYNLANNTLSFKLDTSYLAVLAEKTLDWFSGYRFADIPFKNPQCTKMFLSDLYFTLLDFLPQLQFTNWSLDDDDFNLVTNRAETGKQDTTTLEVGENSRHNDNKNTELNMLSNGTLSNENESHVENRDNGNVRQQSNSAVENVDNKTDQNIKNVVNTFLSAQNQGVLPTITNVKGQGVDGLTLNPGTGFFTNANNSLTGDSTQDKNNTSSTANQAEQEAEQENTSGANNKSEQRLSEDNQVKTGNQLSSEIGGEQNVNLEAVKNDTYVATLDFNRAGRLQDFYNLNKDRLWIIILKNLSKWILQMNIATSETNYLECPIYK